MHGHCYLLTEKEIKELVNGERSISQLLTPNRVLLCGETAEYALSVFRQRVERSDWKDEWNFVRILCDIMLDMPSEGVSCYEMIEEAIDRAIERYEQQFGETYEQA